MLEVGKVHTECFRVVWNTFWEGSRDHAQLFFIVRLYSEWVMKIVKISATNI